MYIPVHISVYIPDVHSSSSAQETGDTTRHWHVHILMQQRHQLLSESTNGKLNNDKILQLLPGNLSLNPAEVPSYLSF